ncbi:MAG: BNR-4 repeat-containing protein [Verrucomicrobiota bacterium]
MPGSAEECNLTENGAWCWFQDPRAVFVKGNHERTYAQWLTHDGRLQVGAYDHRTEKTEIHTLKEQWGVDDHNVGSILVLPDKRLMVFYAQHNRQGLFCRTTSEPESIEKWEDEITVTDSDRITYNHPVYLSEEKRFYVFWRGPTWKPTFSTSPDGKTWSEPKILIQDDDRKAKEIRPYTKITDDGKSSIHITFTDGHPRDEKENSVYYLRYEKGRFLKADGSLVRNMDQLPIPQKESDRVYDGSTKGRGWVWDIALDQDGLPVIAYTRLPDETDHRYQYARWDGKKWLDVQVSAGGKWFPQTPDGVKEREPHYSGGMALDHADPSVLYISLPVKEAFEILQLETPDKGKTWNSKAITQNSQHLNIRPVVPRGHTGRSPHVLWMFGSYEHFTKFSTGIKMIELPR